MIKISYQDHRKAHGKGLVLLGSLLLTLAITGGLFAYAYTTRTTTITVTGGAADYATITDNTSLNYAVLGRLRGTIGTGTLFNISKDGTYTGDVEVQVHLANVDELTKDYSWWGIRLELQDSSGAPMDIQGETQLLTIDNPIVSFYSENATPLTSYLYCDGGAFRAFPFSWLTPYDPLLFVQVVQAGAHP